MQPGHGTITHARIRTPLGDSPSHYYASYYHVVGKSRPAIFIFRARPPWPHKLGGSGKPALSRMSLQLSFFAAVFAQCFVRRVVILCYRLSLAHDLRLTTTRLTSNLEIMLSSPIKFSVLDGCVIVKLL